MIVDFPRRADLHDAPFIHHRNFMAERERFALVMGDVNRGQAEIALDALQFKAHAVTQLRIEVGERLIEQKQFRLHDKCARQRQALLLATRQAGGFTLGILIKRHGGEDAHDLFTNFILGELGLAHFQREGSIGEDRHMRPDRVRLEHHAEIALVRRDEDFLLSREHQAAIDRNLAAHGTLEARNRAQRRRLAAARGAKQGEEFSSRNLEGHILRGFDRRTLLAWVFSIEPLHCEHVPLPFSFL